MSFIGKVILITGGSGGIGAACAVYFAKKGAFLALVGRNEEKFQKVIDKIKDSGVEMEPLIIIADVSTDAERIINGTIEKFGSLDILINNAGFSIPGTIESMKMEDYDAMMATNVRGVVELTQLALPHLIESKGNIVNVSSGLSLMTSAGMIAYSISKSALDKFTKCVAIEIASKGVRINAVNPAVIDTDFHTTNYGIEQDQAEFNKNFLEQCSSKHPLQRVGNTDDCVNAIAFLASSNSDFITGTLLPVDGGITSKAAL